MKNKIVVVFSSHLSDEKNENFVKHISNTIGVKNYKTVCYSNFNQFSLAEVYNQAIREHNDENTIMVFCHNDITIKTRDWGKFLLRKFNNSDFQIIGVAGSTYLHDSGMWWHDRSKMHGIVEHTNGINNWVSEYSKHIPNFIKPVVNIDGLFMCIDCNEVKHYFDEDFNGFHFYDLPICFNNILDGYNVGVTTDIRILHQSIGMTDEEWEKNRQLFVKKFKDELPFNIEDYL